MAPKKPMARETKGKTKSAFLVSVSAIKAEIREAAKKLRGMQKDASQQELKAIEHELRILERVCDELGNIECI